MRSVLLIGLIIVCLIIGFLVVKNTGEKNALKPDDGKMIEYKEKASDAAKAIQKKMEPLKASD